MSGLERIDDFQTIESLPMLHVLGVKRACVPFDRHLHNQRIPKGKPVAATAVNRGKDKLAVDDWYRRNTSPLMKIVTRPPGFAAAGARFSRQFQNPLRGFGLARLRAGELAQIVAQQRIHRRALFRRALFRTSAGTVMVRLAMMISPNSSKVVLHGSV
ncbi:MAG: hypothetical protein ACK4N4_06990 [Burkholderiales bacterium]